MDERHWWLAGKIAECFCLTEDLSIVERFVCRPSIIETIDRFFGIDGPTRLFVYRSVNYTAFSTTSDYTAGRESEEVSSLRLTDGLSPVEASEIADATTVLYFLRHGTERELELGHFEREVFCGILRGSRASAVENLQFLLQSVYAPIAGVQSTSGSNSSAAVDAGSKGGLQLQLKKLAASLSESGLSLGPFAKPVVSVAVALCMVLERLARACLPELDYI